MVSRRSAAIMVAAGALTSSACAPLPAGTAGTAGTPNGAVVGEPVSRIGPFADVRAIAVAPTRAFIVADGGLAIYDRNRRAWLPPLPLGFAVERGSPYRVPCAAVTNLIGDVVWIACGTRVTVVRPAIDAVWATDLGEPVAALAASRGGGDAWAFVGGGVAVVSSAGTARPLGPGETVPAERIAGRTAVGGSPALTQALNDPLLLRDDALRSWPPTAASRGDGVGDSWVGTLGGGVFLVDIDFHRSRQLPFGLRGGSVRSVSRTATGVIAAEDPVNDGRDRSVITIASDDLSVWQWPSLYTGLGALSAVVAREGTICIAGELGAGTATLKPLANSPSAALNNDHRLFEPASTAIATRAGCAVGTDRSVVILPWPASESGSPAGPRTLGRLPPVRALVSSGDTIWIGTLGGLYRASSADGQASPLRLPPSVAQNIVAVALTADGLAVASPGEVWIGSGPDRTESFARPVVSVARIGRLTTLAADATTLWIGGSNGALVIALASGQTIDVALDDPRALAPPTFGARQVRSIALAPGVAWLGTAAGLVRIRRGPDGLPR